MGHIPKNKENGFTLYTRGASLQQPQRTSDDDEGLARPGGFHELQ